jgi:streptogramin lyase
LLYYTRYQSPAEVKKVNYSYDGGTNFVLSNATSIVTLNGADGLTVAPDGSLILGTCGNGTIARVNPASGVYSTVPAGGGACHLALDPKRTRAWAGFTYGGSVALSEIPLMPYFANGIAHAITGSESSVGTLAWDPAGNAYYTVSSPSGIGNFGAIDLTTYVTTRLLSNIPAAHGMAYDPFSGTFILFGSTHITQVTATPTPTNSIPRPGLR